MALSDKRKESMYNYAKANLKRIPLMFKKRNTKKSRLLQLLPVNL